MTSYIDKEIRLNYNSDNQSLPTNWKNIFSHLGKICSLTSAQNLHSNSLFRTLLMLLLMVVGNVGAWAQAPDYSGTYYIASYAKVPSSNPAQYFYDPTDPTNTNNYYLCPSDGWIYYQKDNNWTATKAESDGPFLTTYKCRTAAYDAQGGMNNAKWVVTKHGDYYTFYHTGTSKYLVLSSQISGCGVDRMRVHLEAIDSPETNDNALFTIASDGNPGFYIAPKTIPGDRLTVNGGNKNALTGQSGKPGGPKGSGYNYENTAGIVGIYRGTGTDDNRYFYLEDYITRPTISFDSNDNKIIITNNTTSSSGTIYYTTNGDDPTLEASTRSSFTDASKMLESFTDGTIIKAVAKVGDEYSNVVTSTAFVHVGSSNQYLIQNVERTDFYMIPGDVDKNNNTTVNTTSLFRPTMSWYFSDAGSVNGVQYYYIINGHTGDYLYRTGNNVYMKTSSDFDNSDGYRFFIEQGYKAENDPDGFHIVPKGVTDNTYCIYKGGWENASTIANSKADAMKAGGNARRPEQKHTRWNFVQPNTLNKTAPFTVSDASTHITKFYKIANLGYYIVPPTGNNTNASTTNSTNADVVKSGTWYLEEAQAANDFDWCTYYHIRNAETGQYLYFTKDGSNYTSDPKACLEMHETISGDADCYMFTWARTADETENYYVVPKKLKDASLNKIGTLQRNGSTLQSNLTRDAGNYAWTFEEIPLFCNNPVFEKSGDNIVISCIPGSAEIHYTIDGSDPTTSSYSVYPPTEPLSASDQHLIKAYAVVSDGATPTPTTANSPGVVTLFNNPDFVIKEGENVVNENTYTYSKTAKEPSVDEVSVTVGETKYTATPASLYTVTYSNNIDAGTATVNIEDADATDTWYILNASKTFTIKKKDVTVTADDKTKGYGDTDPQWTVTVNGLIEGDDITEAYTITGISRENGEDRGNYTITLTGTPVEGNYSVTSFDPTATLTITPKALNKDEAGSPADGITITVTKDTSTEPATYNVVVKHGEAKTLVPYTDNETQYDYTLSGESGASGYVVTITAKEDGNYSGFAKTIYADPKFWEDGATWSENVNEYAAVYLAHSDVVPSPFASGSEIKAYIVKKVNPTIGTVTISPVEYNVAGDPSNYIPEDVPVVLLSNNQNIEGFTTSAPTEATSDITAAAKSSNRLMVSDGSVVVKDAEAYIFYKGEFVLTKEGTISSGKFFLYNPNYKPSGGGSSGVRSYLQLVFEDDETSISEELRVKSEESANTVYDLSGRKINSQLSPFNSQLKKGVYIMNGKKVVLDFKR